MPVLETLHDAAGIESILRRDPWLNVYGLGDLDPFFRPRTIWFGLEEGNAVACLYHGASNPTLLAFGGPETAVLLEALAPLLPPRFYAHLSPGLSEVLARFRPHDPRGRHLKMGLTDPTLPADSAAIALTPADADELRRFYDETYPGNWFDPRMLETGAYRGLREDGRLVSAGGVHVLSLPYRVAALGNVATRPDRRGRGLARLVVAAICRALAPHADHVGLNVEATNAPAIRCYESLGFTPVAEYDEAWFGDGVG